MDFESEIKFTFLDEASQLLEEAEASFLDLESNPSEKTIEKIFRLAHNLKGSAKAVGFVDINLVAHEFESLLLIIKKDLVVSPKRITALLKCLDFIKHAVDVLRSNLNENLDTAEIIATLSSASQSIDNGPMESRINESRINESRINESRTDDSMDNKLDPVGSDSRERSSNSEIEGFHTFEDADPAIPVSVKSIVEDMIDSAILDKPTSAKSAQTSAATSQQPGKQSNDETVRVSLKRLEQLIDSVGEVVILNSVLEQLASTSQSLALQKTTRQLAKASRKIQDISMGLRMVPLRSIFQKIKRTVRDTSAALGKEIEFVSEGEEQEVDKTVFERISDPIVHLIRNSIDHGIESESERTERGKRPAGKVSLRAFQRSGKLVIEVEDDGKGLNPALIVKAAVKKGVVKESDRFTDEQAYNLIFAPGFSTKQEVTDVSGRGVGMDVVKTNIADLKGDITIRTEINRGTCFSIQLPLTLAIIDAMTIECGTHKYIVPLSQVSETLTINASQLQNIPQTGPVLVHREESIPFFRISDLLKVKETSNSSYITLIVRSPKYSFAIAVDRVLSRNQVVIKQLGREVPAIGGVVGSTILGDGKPALILDLPELVSSHGQTLRKNVSPTSQKKTTTSLETSAQTRRTA